MLEESTLVVLTWRVTKKSITWGSDLVNEYLLSTYGFSDAVLDTVGKTVKQTRSLPSNSLNLDHIIWKKFIYIYIYIYKQRERENFSVILGILACWCSVAQSCPIFCDPMDCQAPLSRGFPKQEYWCELPFPSPGDLPDPGIEPSSPALQAVSLPLSHWGSSICGTKVIKTGFWFAFLW